MKDLLSNVETWIARLDEPALQAKLAEVNAQLQSLHEERRQLAATLAFIREWNEAPMQPVPEAHVPLDSDLPIQGKTDAILRILGSEPNRQWTAPDVAEVMLERGWMEHTPNDHASLASTLSRLYSEKRIHRPLRGHYQLAPPKGVIREEF